MSQNKRPDSLPTTPNVYPSLAEFESSLITHLLKKLTQAEKYPQIIKEGINLEEDNPNKKIVIYLSKNFVTKFPQTQDEFLNFFRNNLYKGKKIVDKSVPNLENNELALDWQIMADKKISQKPTQKKKISNPKKKKEREHSPKYFDRIKAASGEKEEDYL